MDRSEVMSRIKCKDTKPEILVRKHLFSRGYRYRKNVKDLPGKPDLVFPGRKKIIFIHGCFWHRHEGCKRTRTPKSNIEFWKHKFEKNIERDKSSQQKLVNSGWKILIIWECALLRDPEDTLRVAENWLNQDNDKISDIIEIPQITESKIMQ